MGRATARQMVEDGATGIALVDIDTEGLALVGKELEGSGVAVLSITADVGDMVAALRRVAGDEVAERVRWEYDPAIDRIVRTWPRDFDAAAGRSLGMVADADFDAIVRQYMTDEL